MPNKYSKRLLIRWIPIPEIMAKLLSKFISLLVSTQADSQVPKPPIPLIGKAELISAPVIPKMVLKKFVTLKSIP